MQKRANLFQHMPCWADIENHKARWKYNLKELFDRDPKRAEKFSLQAGSLFLDFSKNHVSSVTVELLLQAANEAKLPQAIEDLLSGKIVNTTENRPAWHSALRSSNPPAEVKAAKTKMQAITEKLNTKKWLGFSDEAITDVVNIGIGGSDLGPRMAVQALSDHSNQTTKVHFVANVDAAEIDTLFQKLNPKTTLFIIASKSFSTLETIENAKTARRWLIQNACPLEQLSQHFIAISTNITKAEQFGVATENILPMWDWVGGRYSMWSTIGLSIAIACGWEDFCELLAGAEEMDQHFADTPLKENMPVIMALLTLWYGQCWDVDSQALLPYSHQLRLFPNFLQQLDMESLGKSTNKQGARVNYPTGLAIWGTEESNAQHSFHQLFHQGLQTVPVDFIGIIKPNHQHDTQHRQLLISCLSQSQAFIEGKTRHDAEKELIAEGESIEAARALSWHKEIPGDRPSNTLLMDQLCPRTLGSLTALYEHKVYCLSVLLNINAFDQWGVELGKELAHDIYSAFNTGAIPETWDSSTRQLAARILQP